MKKHIMNKEVHHDGVKYAKGAVVKESDKGFKTLKESGHIDTQSFEADSDSAAPEAEGEAQAEVAPEADAQAEVAPEADAQAEVAPEADAQPSNKKHGRRG